MRDIEVALASPRQGALRARVEMFDNKWARQLDEELKKQFVEKTYTEIRKMADTSMNIFRRIVREICSVYREPAVRKLKNSSEDQQTALDKVFRDLRADQTMQVAHRYAKAATMSFILVRHPENRDSLVLRVLTPDQVYVEADPEDPTKMALFAYVTEVKPANGKAKVKVWTAYTMEERWFCDSKGKILPPEKVVEVFGAERAAEYQGEDGMKNPYGIIPAVAFPAEFQIRDFWMDDWNTDAAEANLKIGLLWTYMNYLVKTQSFKQIVIKSEDVSKDVKDGILDPLFPLLLGGTAEATTLDLNTRLDAIDAVIRGKVSAIANNYGISQENFALTTQAASGFSLKIANQSLQDIRMADIPLCASVEQELYKVVATVLAAEGLGEFSPDGEIQFNPGEVSWPEEWTTEQARWEFEFKNGVSSPIDYLLDRDPQMDRKAAEEYIAQRQAEIKRLKPATSPWEALLSDRAQPAGQPASGPSQALAGFAAAKPEAPAEAVPAKEAGGA